MKAPMPAENDMERAAGPTPQCSRRRTAFAILRTLLAAAAAILVFSAFGQLHSLSIDIRISTTPQRESRPTSIEHKRDQRGRLCPAAIAVDLSEEHGRADSVGGDDVDCVPVASRSAAFSVRLCESRRECGLGYYVVKRRDREACEEMMRETVSLDAETDAMYKREYGPDAFHLVLTGPQSFASAGAGTHVRNCTYHIPFRLANPGAYASTLVHTFTAFAAVSETVPAVVGATTLPLPPQRARNGTFQPPPQSAAASLTLHRPRRLLATHTLTACPGCRRQQPHADRWGHRRRGVCRLSRGGVSPRDGAYIRAGAATRGEAGQHVYVFAPRGCGYAQTFHGRAGDACLAATGVAAAGGGGVLVYGDGHAGAVYAATVGRVAGDMRDGAGDAGDWTVNQTTTLASRLRLAFRYNPQLARLEADEAEFDAADAIVLQAAAVSSGQRTLEEYGAEMRRVFRFFAVEYPRRRRQRWRVAAGVGAPRRWTVVWLGLSAVPPAAFDDRRSNERVFAFDARATREFETVAAEMNRAVALKRDDSAIVLRMARVDSFGLTLPLATVTLDSEHFHGTEAMDAVVTETLDRLDLCASK
ncbi:hypothetical protein DFJ73DRAFT_902155 [Zopfochytrium polystomum]|nr:hypothetical protein DFJ73DRAFT_902155 [Zopfochytrium polystomum]